MFDKMHLDYGKKFTDQWGGTDTDRLIAHWAHEMASYSGAEIKRGLAAMEGRDWPPTLPEFKKMCRPPLDSLAGYYEAVNGMQARDRGDVGEWSHPAIFWAAATMTFDLLSQAYSQIKGRWEAALNEQIEKGQWAAIPKPMLAIAAPGKGKTDRDQAGKVLAEIGAIAPQKSDHRAWINSVFARAKRKDTTLPNISIRFAKEALSIKDAP